MQLKQSIMNCSISQLRGLQFRLTSAFAILLGACLATLALLLSTSRLDSFAILGRSVK